MQRKNATLQTKKGGYKGRRARKPGQLRAPAPGWSSLGPLTVEITFYYSLNDDLNSIEEELNTYLRITEEGIYMGFLSFIKGSRKPDRAGSSRSGKAERLFTEGKNFSDQCRYEEAKRCYEEAIKLDPDFVDVWNNWGSVHERQGDHEEALRCWNRAIKLNPNFKKVWNNKGNVLFRLGRHDEAIKCYEEAIKLDPNYGLAWQNKGEVLEASGRQSEADEALTKARKLLNK
jgi:tetratricopeptide (TPR) repeat protein